MAIVSDGDQSAYARLKSRATTALDFNQEQPSIEFKRSVPWDDVWVDLTRAVLGMSNLRDGGIIIIGRPDDGTADGITSTDLATYDPDVMRDKFGAFASPQADVTIARITHTCEYLVIEVNEFTDLPVVCKKMHNRDLVKGGLYIRPFTGRPQTRLVESAEETRAVLDMAIEKGIRRFNATAARSGFVAQANDAAAYAKQLGDLNGV